MKKREITASTIIKVEYLDKFRIKYTLYYTVSPNNLTYNGDLKTYRKKDTISDRISLLTVKKTFRKTFPDNIIINVEQIQ